MSAADQIREAFHQFASLLVWPVLLGLIGLGLLLLIAIGAYLREAWQRLRGRKPARLVYDLEALQTLATSGADELDLTLEAYLQEAERWRWRRVNRIRMVVRLGPTLGLMGTLIPMADALQGLAEGDLPSLASNMVTAFAATVVGLTLSVIAYLVSAGRENWVRDDAQQLAFQAERVLRQATRGQAHPRPSVPCETEKGTQPVG